MTGWQALRRFLTTDPADAGCAETFRILDAYVDRELTIGDAETHYPSVGAHLRICMPCAEDYRGLLAAVRDTLG